MNRGKSGNISDPHDSLSLYLRDISRCPRFSPEEEAELARTIRKNEPEESEEALKKLVLSNLRFVVDIAKKYHGWGTTLSDLINEGNTGLIEAARRFDPDKGVQFTTYAVWWIRQAILKALAEYSGIVRLPLQQANLSYQIIKVYRELSQKYQRDPTLQEIAHKMEMKEKDIIDILRVVKNVVSLDVPDDSEKNYAPVVRADADDNNPLKEIEKTLFAESIEELLANLSPREREIIKMRYGFDDREPMNLENIGKKLNLTKERIRQIENQAKEKLRRMAVRRHLKDYLN